MNVSFILFSCLAVFLAHVARGDDCSSLKPGDRYCVDDTTSRTCTDNGQYTDDKCPPNSKCMQSPTQKSTLCREMNKNAGGEASPAPGGESAPTKSKSAEKTPKTPKDDGKQADQGASPAPTAEKPETCTADVGTLKPGDRYCVDDKKHRVCNYGEWVEDSCPDGFKCMKSPTQWQVLCRQINKNTDNQQGPQNSEPSPPTNPDQKPQPSNPAPAPAQTQAPAEPAPAQTQAPAEPAPAQTTAAPAQPAPVQTQAPAEPAPASAQTQAPTDASTCAGGMKVGERKCTGDNTYQLCDNDGKVVDDKCPDNSQCKTSPSGQGIICRQFVRNTPQEQHQRRRR